MKTGVMGAAKRGGGAIKKMKSGGMVKKAKGYMKGGKVEKMSECKSKKK